jgi:hypothetical protein
MNLQWEKYGKAHVGLNGAEVVCIIGPAEGAPLEMFMLQYLDGAYTTLEAAQAAAEENTGLPSRQPSMNDWLIPALETVIGNLKALSPPRAP